MKDNVDLICSIGELAGLFERTTSLENFLQTAVSVVAYHMRAAVCSVYLFDEATGDLVLTANQGLSSSSIGKVRLKLGEGLTGKALKELRPIREGLASKSPHWKHIPGIHEEKFEAFLAVPITRGLTRVGALVVQDPVPDYFDENDTKALLAIAAQLASVIENAKLLMTLGHLEKEEPKPAGSTQFKFLRGAGAASGWAVGRAFVFGTMEGVPDTARGAKRDDFLRSLAATERQLEALQVEMEERLADVASLIFSAHLLMVKDSKFGGSMLELIDRGSTAAEAITRVVDQYSQLFARSQNPRLREKVQDVKDLGRRLLRNLGSESEEEVDYHGRIIVAAELLPSEILRLAAQKAEGLVLIGGGMHSHISILARSLQLPLVILDERGLLKLDERNQLLIDGDQGTLYVDPGEEVLNGYRGLQQAAREAELVGERLPEQARTLDGERVEILANINMLSEVKLSLKFKAAGVGLYRSEFPFIVRNDFPSEEEQFRIYRKLLEDMEGRDVCLRTLDVGGDKMLSYFPNVNESNPFLGLRALRFSFRHRDIFVHQLRAMLRAGHDRPLHIMFPMVSSVDDFLEARAIVDECRAQLAAEGLDHQREPKLGAMIELPSAVEVVEELAVEADFLSIGGNDLVQYMLAVDRTNEHISDMYLAYHPAVLRALDRIACAARRHQRPLSFCGEMATDPKLMPFLLGIGLRRISVDARQIPRVHQTLAGLSTIECRALADRILRMGRIRDIAEVLGVK